MIDVEKIIQSPMFNGYCDPTTLAIISATAAVAGTATTAVAASNQAEFEEDLAKRNADIEAQKAEIEVERVQRERERRLGALRASAGASGIGVQTGTPLDLLGQVARRSAEDEAITRIGGRERVTQQVIAGRAAGTRGQTALLGGALDTTGTAASGIADIQATRR